MSTKAFSQRGLLPTLFFFLMASAPVWSGERTFFSETDLRAVSEPMAIKPFAEDFDGSLHSGSVAWTRNRFRAGLRNDQWTLAWVQRYDYVLRFNDDTAELYYQDRNALGLDADRTYALRLHGWHLRAQGIQFERRWSPRDGWVIAAGMNLLHAMALQDGSATGRIQSGELTYTGSARVDYRYSEDRLFEHQARAPGGAGASLDLALAWAGESRAVSFRLEDLAGFIVWDEAPYTDVELDTAGQILDERVSVPPLMSGHRGVRDYRQEMPVQASLHAEQALPSGTLALDAVFYVGRVYPTLGMRWDQLGLAPSLGYGLRDHQVTVGLGGAGWRLNVGMDAWQAEEARSLSLGFDFSRRF